MKHICLKLVLFVLSVFTCLSVFAYDFEADGLYFTITSPKDLTVSVDGAVNKDICEIVIPQTVVYKGKTLTVTAIGNGAFNQYKNLQSVSLPKTVLSIGRWAFAGNELLTDVVLPDSLSEIGEAAFMECTSLKTIRIPKKVVLINDWAFQHCSGLISVTLNDNVKSIGNFAFLGTSIKELKLPLSLSSIGVDAFASTKIREINLPKSLISIGYGAFSNTKVRHIDVGVEDIPDGCFVRCDSLKYIRWTGDIKSIGSEAFYGCSSLESFTIPSSVEEISASIIKGCPNILKLTIGRGLKGLPFEYDRREIETLRRSYRYKCSVIQHLDRLKTIIIEDSRAEFSIKGEPVEVFREICYYPAFYNLDLDYFYVGRPLVDIHSWNASGYTCMVDSGIKSIGHIKKLEISGYCTINPYFYQEVDTLTLGARIKFFDADSLHLDSLKVIEIKSTTPPIMLNGTHIPNKVYTDVTLYVPKGCKDAYSNDPDWGSFWDIREYEGDCNTEVTNVTDDLKDIAITTQNGSIIVSNAPHNTLVQVYNLQGALVAKSQCSVISGLSKGAYLVNVGGKTFKVVL